MTVSRTSQLVMSRRYNNFNCDSERWQHFVSRPSDIVVSTAAKAGTTWTQMICALLVHGVPPLPKPLAELSPWLDLKLAPIDAVIDNFEAQSYRRIIKTHTPLDGLPYSAEVDYVICSRHPLDVFMSLQNHLANADMAQGAKLFMAQGVGLDEMPPPLPDDIGERFGLWLTASAFDWEHDGLPLGSVFHHTQAWWEHRHLPNIHFLHYADLTANLAGEMQRLAGLLNIAVADAEWPALIAAATFSSMKANADTTAPDTHHAIWQSNSNFFNKGGNEQWRGVLPEDSIALYEEVIASRYDPAMLEWLERGSIATADPRQT